MKVIIKHLPSNHVWFCVNNDPVTPSGDMQSFDTITDEFTYLMKDIQSGKVQSMGFDIEDQSNKTTHIVLSGDVLKQCVIQVSE